LDTASFKGLSRAFNLMKSVCLPHISVTMQSRSGVWKVATRCDKLGWRKLSNSPSTETNLLIALRSYTLNLDCFLSTMNML